MAECTLGRIPGSRAEKRGYELSSRASWPRLLAAPLLGHLLLHHVAPARREGAVPEVAGEHEVGPCRERLSRKGGPPGAVQAFDTPDPGRRVAASLHELDRSTGRPEAARYRSGERDALILARWIDA